MDVDAQDEELADLHVDLAAREVDATGAGDGGGNRLGGADGAVQEILVEGCLYELSLARLLHDVDRAVRVAAVPSYSAPTHG